MRRWTAVHLDEHISSTMGATLLRGADWYVVYSSKERCHPIQWSLWTGTAEALGVWRSQQEDEAEDLADTPNSGMEASLSPGQMVMPHRPVFIKSPTEENSWLPHPRPWLQLISVPILAVASLKCLSIYLLDLPFPLQSLWSMPHVLKLDSASAACFYRRSSGPVSSRLVASFFLHSPSDSRDQCCDL